MPSVGSTPTTTSPAQQPTQTSQQQQQQQQQQPAQPQQTSVTATTKSTATGKRHKPSKALPQHQQTKQPPPPLQLQYQHCQPQQSAQPHSTPTPPSSASASSAAAAAAAAHVTTTQPAPAGVFTHNNNAGSGTHNGGDISPISSSNSYSSVDTNQTLLNSIANQQHQSGQAARGQRRSHKYSQFMIITPAVSIDRDFEYESHGCDLDFEDFANAAHNNGNLFRLGLRRSGSSIDSGNSSDSSFRSNYNSYLHHSRQHLLPKAGSGNNRGRGGGSTTHNFYAFSSWRWCTLICAAMRCFGAGHSSHTPYSSSFVRGGGGGSNAPHYRLRRCSSTYNTDYAYEHFAAPFKARKTRDHMNNIMYEL